MLFSKPLTKLRQSIFAVIAVGALTALPAISQTVTGTGAIDSFTFSGSKAREYKVYVPQSYDGTEAVPMIFALHGCAMDHTDALNLWNFDLIADQNNVIVVFPFVTSFTESRSENCWGYWFPTHVREGQGGEVDDLYGMGVEVESMYNIDPDRRYITGISSGGGMTVAAGIAYNDYWAAMAPVEAPAYGDGSNSVLMDQFEPLSHHVDEINDELNDDHKVPTFVVHSTNDTTVMIKGGELIRDSQLTVWGPDLNADETEDCTTEGINCTITTYNDEDGNPLVKTMFYDGVDGHTASLGKGHHWVGDDGASTLWAEDQGPSASQHIWSFFETVTLAGFDSCEDPSDVTAPSAPSGLAAFDIHDKYASMSISSTNSEADFKRYALYHSNGASAGYSSSASISISGLTSETAYSLYVTAMDNCGNESAASNTVSFTTGALEYIAPSAVASATGHYNAGRVDSAGYIALGGTYGYIDTFTLWQLQDGSWTDVDQAEAPTSTPTPTATPTATPTPTPTATPTPTPTATPTPTPTATPTPTPTATPTPTPTPPPASDCSEYTSTNGVHASAGRGYNQYVSLYYATGSNDYLGIMSQTTTVNTTDGGTSYSVGSCP